MVNDIQKTPLRSVSVNKFMRVVFFVYSIALFIDQFFQFLKHKVIHVFFQELDHLSISKESKHFLDNNFRYFAFELLILQTKRQKIITILYQLVGFIIVYKLSSFVKYRL